jgi:hypothetical protein
VYDEKLGTKNNLVTYLKKMPTLPKPSASSAKAQKKITVKKRDSPEESDQSAQESPSEHEESSESEEEQDLHGLTTDDDDDSSDEDDNIDANPVDVDKLPTIAKDDAVVRAKLEKAKRQAVGHPCFVCYLLLTTDRLTIAASYSLVVYRMDFLKTS